MASRKKKSSTTRRTRKSHQSRWAWLGRLAIVSILLWLGIYAWHDWERLLQIVAKGWDKATQTTPPPHDNAPTEPTPPKQDGKPSTTTAPNLKVASWNIAHFGRSKDDQEIAFIADVIKDYDLVALQEVSVEDAGARAVARLSDELNRKGNKWTYTVSSPTSGEGCERYAFIWKTRKVTLHKNAWLATGKNIDQLIDREPYLARFNVENRTLTVANFHAVPSTKNPANEARLLDDLHRLYDKDNLVIAGDFNLAQHDPAFDELKKYGYAPVLTKQKTSLRRTVEPSGNYLSQEYDNIFIESLHFTLVRSGINDFVPKAKSLKNANNISDHLPVWCEIRLR